MTMRKQTLNGVRKVNNQNKVTALPSPIPYREIDAKSQ